MIYIRRDCVGPESLNGILFRPKYCAINLDEDRFVVVTIQEHRRIWQRLGANKLISNLDLEKTPP